MKKPAIFFRAMPFLLGALCLNEFVLPHILGLAGWQAPEEYAFAWGQLLFAADFLALFCLVNAVILIAGQSLRKAWKSSPAYIFFVCMIGVGLLFATNPVLAGRFAFLRLFLCLGIILGLMKWVVVAFVRNPRPPGKLLQNTGLMFAGLLGLFFLIEGVFLFIPRSHGNMHSLASRVWFQKYWQTNSLGFRDAEPKKNQPKSNYTILLSGDSFTAGHGVEKKSDRFGNILSKRLGDQYSVANLGMLGYGPELELDALKSYPKKGDAVIVCWYVNDIHDAAIKAGIPLNLPTTKEYRKRTLNPADCSYLLNFLVNWMPDKVAGEKYQQFLTAGFSNKESLNNHFEAIFAIQEWAKSSGMAFGMVMFPSLTDVSGSAGKVTTVKGRLSQAGIPILDLTPLLKDFEPKKLIVNSSDAHPNEFVHQLTADTLAGFFQEYILPQVPDSL